MAMAQTEFTVDGVKYRTAGTGVVEVIGVNAEVRDLTVPAQVSHEGTTYQVTSVADEAFYWTELTSLTLPEGIVSIGNHAIKSNENLTAIHLPSTLQTIGENAFAYNRKLTSIVIPSLVTTIPASCFAGCSALADIQLPQGITAIGDGAFYKTAITTFTLPENCTQLGNNVFQNCLSLTRVNLNGALTEMGEGVFRGCSMLTDINLETATRLTSIPIATFEDCKALTAVTIPIGVKYIDTNALSGSGVQSISLADNHPYLEIDGGAVYDKQRNILEAFPPKSAQTELVVREGCISVGGLATSGITSVVLPSSVRSIEPYAFYQCKLTEINLPAGIISIGDWAFAYNLFTNIELPLHLRTLGTGAFANCEQLISATLESELQLVSNQAFFNCKKLIDVFSKAAVAPTLQAWTEDYENAFSGVTATLHIPQGAMESYQSADWPSALSNIVMSEPAALVPQSISPERGAMLRQFEGVTLTFAEPVNVNSSDVASVELRAKSELWGDVIVPDGGWMIVKDGSDNNKVIIFPSDYDGYTSPIKLDPEKYYFYIPGGVISNESGVATQGMILTFEGIDPMKDAFLPTSTTPATNEQLTEIAQITLHFDREATVQQAQPKIRLYQGDSQTGEEVTSAWRAAQGENTQDIVIVPTDLTEKDITLPLQENETYTVVVPEMLGKDVEEHYTKRFELVFTGQKPTGVEQVSSTLPVLRIEGRRITALLPDTQATTLTVYDLNGNRINRMEGVRENISFEIGAAGQYIVVVERNQKIQTFKVAIR